MGLGYLDMSDVRGAARDALEASRALTTPPGDAARSVGPVIIEKAHVVGVGLGV